MLEGDRSRGTIAWGVVNSGVLGVTGRHAKLVYGRPCYGRGAFSVALTGASVGNKPRNL